MPAVTSILVVDDDRCFADRLVQLLSESRFTAVGLYSASAAIEWCKAHPVDVLLTDFVMPVTDGIALIAAVRDLDLAICSILMSSLRHDQAREIGDWFDAFLQKPFTMEQLYGAIEEACHHRQRWLLAEESQPSPPSGKRSRQYAG